MIYSVMETGANFTSVLMYYGAILLIDSFFRNVVSKLIEAKSK